MADFPVFEQDRLTLGNVVNKLEQAPHTRQAALDVIIAAAKPYIDRDLSVQSSTFRDSQDSGFASGWTSLHASMATGDAQRLARVAGMDLDGAAVALSDAFFGPLGLSQGERSAMMQRLTNIFIEPREAISVVGDKNFARAAQQALMDAEVARAKGLARAGEYLVPAYARNTAVDRADNRIDTLATVALSAMERRFLEFDRGLQDELVQIRLRAAKALYGEMGEAFATTMMFTGQVAVPAYARAQGIRPTQEDLAGRYARIYQTAFETRAGKVVANGERNNTAMRETYASWKLDHDLKNQAFAEATRAIVAAAGEVSRQLSAALNAVSGSGSIGSSGSLTERWKTINIDENGVAT